MLLDRGRLFGYLFQKYFPTPIRAKGQAFGASIHWIFAALITLITPVFLDSEYGIFKENPWPIFVFFAVMMTVFN